MNDELKANGGVPLFHGLLTHDPYSSQIQLTEGVRLSGEAAQELVVVGNVFRKQYPLLFKFQDWIGFAIFACAVTFILVGARLYLLGLIGGVTVCLSNAFWMSVLHELEHDLIHFMYFRNNWLLHNFMMLGVWVFRPNSISGWARRRMHLHHHRVSGTASDFEERAITNGEAWGAKRLIMLCDHVLSAVLRMDQMKRMQQEYLRAQPDLKSASDRRFVSKVTFLSLFPIGNLFYLSWHLLWIWKLIHVAGVSEVVPQSQAIDGWCNYLLAVLYIPSVLRGFCLQFVSSNIHYFGDVEPGNIIQQTQVWTSWWTLPFQLFCFNFGGTHAIHHFVARETFYVRQLTALQMYPILKKYGVKFNDFGSMWRANRRQK